ncbi:hypothetical protein C7293_02515 [filamentous cyanobacterium CCT1]|nr:hypothetical protein C7293_02515 [filamentous cyanobacterium CCT1]PSN81658.1 hypothetical protein C8B47_00205 [filamentous cyanobacterium CCP4]
MRDCCLSRRALYLEASGLFMYRQNAQVKPNFMVNRISFPLAARVNIGIFGCLILFHLGIIVGILLFNYVPIDFLWGGRLQSKEQFFLFEAISIIIQAICLFLTLIKAGYLRLERLGNIAHTGMWVLFAIFSLNTVGNILAKTAFEKAFTVVTIILALFSLRLALENNVDEEFQ